MGKSGVSGVRLAQYSGAAVGPMAGVGYTSGTFAETEYASAGLFRAEQSTRSGSGRRLRAETGLLMSRGLSQTRPA